MIPDISGSLGVLLSLLFGLDEKLRQRRHYELGKALLSFYWTTKEVVRGAENVFNEAKNLVLRIDRLSEEEKLAAFIQLNRSAQNQINLLRHVSHSSLELTKELDLINPQASYLLFSAFNSRAGKLSDMQREIGSYTVSPYSISHVDEGDLLRVEAYLNEFSPEKGIRQMKDAIETLRAYIVDHWELSEIL